MFHGQSHIQCLFPSALCLQVIPLNRTWRSRFCSSSFLRLGADAVPVPSVNDSIGCIPSEPKASLAYHPANRTKSSVHLASGVKLGDTKSPLQLFLQRLLFLLHRCREYYWCNSPTPRNSSETHSKMSKKPFFFSFFVCPFFHSLTASSSPPWLCAVGFSPLASDKSWHYTKHLASTARKHACPLLHKPP